MAENEKILQEYNYCGGLETIQEIMKLRPNGEATISDNHDFINEIVLWKVNRRVQIQVETIKKLQKVSGGEIELDSQEFTDLLDELLSSPGVRLPMASTILHFYNPDNYPIIDQRAYRALYHKVYPKTTSKKKVINTYVKYVKDCRTYWNDNCKNSGIPFSQTDQLLYQIDKNEGNHVIT